MKEPGQFKTGNGQLNSINQFENMRKEHCEIDQEYAEETM